MGLLNSLFSTTSGQGFENKNHYPQSMLSRTKLIEGKYIYSIINNGGQYFLINMPVYEDGVIYCWENIDLEMLKVKLSTGWVSCQVPNKETISMHHLAGWEIEDSKWLYSKENYHEFIISVVKSMNPTLTNLFNSNGQIAKIIGNTNYSVFSNSGEQLIRKDDDKICSFREFSGKREQYLYKQSNEKYWLCNLNIYGDGIILIEGIEKNKKVTIDELENLIKQGIIATNIPDHSTIMVENLGEFKISKTLYCVDVNEKFSEINDIINKLNGQPDTSELCGIQFEEYNKNPTIENKEKLKVAYEKIPRHLRRYVLGDMDNKDYPIKQIIYKDE